MALSSAAFLDRFPEFSELRAPVELVTACLAEAERRCAASVWGSLHADGVGYLAAHVLSTSPWGQQARLAAQDGSTTYHKEYLRLLDSVTGGFRVTCT